MTPAQCRMARGALSWSLKDLAERAGVGINTVSRLEGGAETLTGTVAKLRAAFESAGVEFIPEDNGGPGVRLRKGGE